MKTIRIKRPEAITKPAAAPAAASDEPATAATIAAGDDQQMLTQRKTLKISRPGAVRPAGKFGVKKPGGAEESEDAEIADIADVADMPAAQAQPAQPTMPPDSIPDVSKGTNITSLIFQIAACVVVGVLGYFLYENTQLPFYLGGCGWGQV